MKDFKIRCLKSDAGFTPGRVYAVSCGKFVDDDGDERPTHSWIETQEDVEEQYPGEFESVEENKMFTKDDLQVNDWVVLRSGEIKRIAEFSGERHIIGSDFWLPLSYYVDSLEFHGEDNAEWDIMKVYRPTDTYMLKEEAAKKWKPVFDRDAGIGCEPPVKEISVEEAMRLLTEKFGKSVKIRVGE